MAKDATRPRRGSQFHLESAFSLFPRSREIVMENLSVFGVLYILPLIFIVHTWIWAPTPGQHTHFWNYKNFSYSFNSNPTPSYLLFMTIGFSILWFLIVVVGGTIFQIMSQAAQLDGAKGSTIRLEKLWATTRELGWRMVGLYLLIFLYILVGFILFIVPGIIMIRRYFLAPYVMLDKKTGIKESMDLSASMSKPYSGAVWAIIGVQFLIGLINILPFIGGLVAFVVAALYSVAPALRYQELKSLPH